MQNRWLHDRSNIFHATIPSSSEIFPSPAIPNPKTHHGA